MVDVAYPLKSLVTKSAEGRLKGVDVENRIVPGYITTPTLDRDKEFVPVDAFIDDLDIYKSNPVLLLHHAHKSLPVGKAVKLEADEKGLYAEYYIAKTPLGDEVLTLCAEGILRGFSTGFMPIDYRLNPQDYELPVQVRGKGCKKMYKRVELVEVSLLAIPSNRSALITQIEKGNKAAELVIKSFDAEAKDEDITHVLKEWMETVNKYFWDESEHPRANDGQFTDANNYTGSQEFREPRKVDPRQSTAVQLQDLANKQEEMRQTLQEIKDRDSWGAWAKKWAIRGAVAVGVIAFLKSKTGKRMSAKAMEHIFSWFKNRAASAYKGISDPDLAQMQLVTNLLDQMRTALQKGKSLGLNSDNSQEYAQLANNYRTIKTELANLVQNETQKGIGDLYIAYKNSDLVSKSLGDMISTYQYGVFGGLMKSVETAQLGLKGLQDEWTAEDERKHPRATDGKFRKKADGAGMKKTPKVGAKVAEESHKPKKAKATDKKNKKSPKDKIPENLYTFPLEKPLTLREQEKAYKNLYVADKAILQLVRAVAPEKTITGKTKPKHHLTIGEQLTFEGILAAAVFSAIVIKEVGLRDFRHIMKAAFSAGYKNARAFFKGIGGLKYGMKLKREAYKAKCDAMWYRYSYRRKAGIATEADHDEWSWFYRRVDRTKWKPPSGTSLKTEEELAKLAREHEVKARNARIKFSDWEEGWTTGKKVKRKRETETAEGEVGGMHADARTQKEKLEAFIKNIEKLKKEGKQYNEGEYQAAKRLYQKKFGAGAKVNDDYKWTTKIWSFFANLGRFFRHAEGTPATNTKKAKAVKKFFLSGADEPLDKETFTEFDEAMRKIKKKHGIGEEDIFGKGFFDIVIKESKETFRKNEMEGDHPRDEGGKFTDSGKAPVAPKAKTTHGGKRIGAGRWPKNADEAVAKLSARFKKENPEMTDEQARQEVLKLAEARAKPDVIEYLTSPDTYWKKRERDSVLASKDKYRSAAYPGGFVTGMDTSDDTATLRKQVKTSERQFRNEVKKQKSYMNAYNAFKDEHSTEKEKNNAGLILAIGSIAATAGIASLLLSKPSLAKSGMRLVDRLGPDELRQFIRLVKARANFKGTEQNKPTFDWIYGHIDPDEIRNIPFTKWLRVVKISNGELPKSSKIWEDPKFKRIIVNKEFGRMNRVATKTLMKMFPTKFAAYPKKEGEQYAIILGEHFRGLGSGSRFQPGQYTTFDRRKIRNFKFEQEEVYDALSGIQITKPTLARRRKLEGAEEIRQYTLDRLSLFNVHKMWQMSPKKGEALQYGMSEKALNKIGLTYVGPDINRNNVAKKYLEYGSLVKFKGNTGNEIRKSQAAFEKAWPELRSKAGFASDEEAIPILLSRKLSSAEQEKIKDAMRLGQPNENAGDNASFWAQYIQPAITNRALAMIVAVGGIGTDLGYLFAEDLNEIPESFLRQNKANVSEFEQMEAMRKWRKSRTPGSKEREKLLKYQSRENEADRKLAIELAKLEIEKSEAENKVTPEEWKKAEAERAAQAIREAKTRQEAAKNKPKETTETETQVPKVSLTELQEKWRHEPNPPRYDEDPLGRAMWLVTHGAKAFKEKQEQERLLGIEQKPNEYQILIGLVQDKFKAEGKIITSSANFDNIVTKQFDFEKTQQVPVVTADAFVETAARDIAKMFRDISLACHDAVESGMPGREDYIDINDSLIKLYQLMLAKSKADKEMGLGDLTPKGITNA